jgi:hypothetical protein
LNSIGYDPASGGIALSALEIMLAGGFRMRAAKRNLLGAWNLDVPGEADRLQQPNEQ